MMTLSCQRLLRGFVLVYGTVLIMVFLVESTASIKWLALTKTKVMWNETRHCPSNKIDRRRYGLTGAQVKLCRRNAPLMPAVIHAARQTRSVCQMQFNDQRWNCTSVDYLPKSTSDLTKGTREQAYVYALSSAAITHAVAKGCASGLVFYCPCGQLPNDSPSGDFKWQGCSDNVFYGIEASRSFADAPWQKQRKRKKALRRQTYHEYEDNSNAVTGDDNNVVDIHQDGSEEKLSPRLQMNQHNNEVGRRIAKNLQQNKCKCHGLSGACTTKTCWKILPPLEDIGLKLKEKYLRATEVRQLSPRILNFQPVALMGRVTDEDLIYIRKSPDYCTEDHRFGSFGTKGRHVLWPWTYHRGGGSGQGLPVQICTLLLRQVQRMSIYNSKALL